jgi:hypothetical protein
MTSANLLVGDSFRRLSEHLFSLCKEHDHVFVLIDRLNPLPDSLAAPIEEAALEAADRCGLSDPLFGEAKLLAPQIVRLGVKQMPLLDVLANTALLEALDPEQPDPSVCGFLVVPGLSAKRLAAHLSRQFNPLTYDGRKIFLRFHDPCVFPRLWSLLDTEQRSNLLGPIDQWMVVSRRGELFRAQREHAGADGNGSRARVALSENALNGALRIEALNLALRALRVAGHEIPSSGDELVDRAVSQAQSMGLAANEDLAAYAALAWVWPVSHGPMQAHTQVAEGIALARQGLPFRDYANERLLPIIQANSRP